MKPVIEVHANGKLLITGEYLVLAGALALALPVCFGQRMRVFASDRGTLDWESVSPAGTWFTAKFDPVSLKVISSTEYQVAVKLKKILVAARRLNPRFLSGPGGWSVIVTANYPLEWGMGSSSTLCSLIASWAEIPVFDLFRKISKGSGFDIACAVRNSLLYYQLLKGQPTISVALAGRALRENTWFVYLGNKQDSAKEASAFLLSQNYADIDLTEVSRLSSAICNAVSPGELIQLVDEHEYLLSAILQREPIARRFSSFPGTVKSLGAWGGDFAMFVSGLDPVDAAGQIRNLGFSTIFSYNDLEIRA
jgi:mevalonate kinase